jgi:hypothetical protein
MRQKSFSFLFYFISVYTDPLIEVSMCHFVFRIMSGRSSDL